MTSLEQTTRLLRNIRRGDGESAKQLMPLLYDELRALAVAIFAQQPTSHTLQPTALLHEAYLKLVDQTASDLTDRAHFMRLAARAMRQVLIDHARSSNAAKRGKGQRQLLAHDPEAPDSLGRLDWLALDEAISQLAELDERQAAVVEMRFMAGLTVQETATALNVSPRTIELDWRMAKAWLNRTLAEDGG